MLPSDVVPRLMFDFEHLSHEEVAAACELLPRKLIRWIAQHHPSNRARLDFLRLTGVPIGEGTVINPYIVLHDSYSGLVSFGMRAAVADHVTIIAVSEPNNSDLVGVPYVRDHLVKTAQVHIGNDAWIGAHAVVLPGVTIGEGAVVGAGAVVTEDVEARTVVAGVPARIVRHL